MMTNPGFPSSASNPTSFVVTIEAFLGLTTQVQALAARTASPTPTPARSRSCSCDLVQIRPDFDTLSSDTADSLREQVRRVHLRLDEVQKEVLKSRGEVGESSKGGSPFTPEIQAKPLPATFRLPTLEPYDGSGNPTEHITAFHAQMALYDTSDALMCRAFLTTLRALARIWYSRLKPASISSFDLLAKEVELNFLARNSRPPSVPSHPSVLDGAETVEVILVADRATTYDPARDAATGASVHDYRDAGGRQAGRDKAPPGGAAPWTSPAIAKEEGRQVEHVAGQTPTPNSPQFNPNRDLLSDSGEGGLLKAPNPMKSHPERRNKRRYCRFHREYRHDTEECRDLQYQIEDLIRRGHLCRYIRDQSSLPDGCLPETHHPGLKARSRNKSTSSSAGQPRAVIAPRH
ncbi:hypothetical protein BHE74_00051941 [Ensete ventricosum]|nr:hypothetical protein BHE74_00051941 [Ensete ventricosum]